MGRVRRPPRRTGGIFQTTSLKDPGPFSIQGGFGLSRGQLGDFTGKRTAAPPENLDVATAGLITITGFAPVLTETEILDVPYGITETLVGFPPTLLEDDSYGLNVASSGLITITGFAPTLVEFNNNDQQLDVATAGLITITGFAPDLIENEDLLVSSAPLISLFADPPTLDEQGLLPPVISVSDALLIADTIFNHLMGGAGHPTFEQMTIDTNAIVRNLRLSGGSSGVSAGGRGLYFEPQTIDKMKSMVDKLIAEVKREKKVPDKIIERVIEHQPIYITSPDTRVVTEMKQPVVIQVDDTEDEEMVMAALTHLMKED